MAFDGNPARFLVNSLPSEDSNGDRGVIVANSALVTCELETIPSGALSARFYLYDPNDPTSPLASADAPLLTWNGSGTATELLTDPDTQNAEFNMAAAGANPNTDIHSYIVRCVVTKADGSYTFERIIATDGTSSALRKTVPAESTEFEARSWSDVLNTMVDAIEAIGGPGPSGNDLQQAYDLDGTLALEVLVTDTNRLTVSNERDGSDILLTFNSKVNGNPSAGDTILKAPDSVAGDLVSGSTLMLSGGQADPAGHFGGYSTGGVTISTLTPLASGSGSGAISLLVGAGSASAHGTSSAGDGSDIDMIAGNGGAYTGGGSGTGGSGGDLDSEAGSGGSANGSGAAGNGGGNVAVAGTGGANSGTGNGGYGGDGGSTAGNGGSAGTGDGGDGGDYYAQAGNGGNSTGGGVAGDGGFAQYTSGTGGDASTGGAVGLGGQLSVIAGAAGDVLAGATLNGSDGTTAIVRGSRGSRVNDSGNTPGDGGDLLVDAGQWGYEIGDEAGNAGIAGVLKLGTVYGSQIESGQLLDNAGAAVAGDGLPGTEWLHHGAVRLHQVGNEAGTNDPTGVAAYGSVFTQLTNGITELFYMDSAGTKVQLTSGGSSAGKWSVTTTAGATTSPAVGNFVRARTSTDGAMTITLPAITAVNEGESIVVKDVEGAALANPITVDTTGGDTIDGAASVVIQASRALLEFVSDGAGDWMVK